MTDQPEPPPARADRAPPPQSISEQARAFLDGLGPPPSYPDPADLDAWRRIVTETERGQGLRCGELFAELPPHRRELVTLRYAPLHRITPEPPPSTYAGRALLHLHGGALVFNRGEKTALDGALSALRFGVRTYALDYRTPPEAPYPAAVQDTLEAYAHLLEHYRPADIIVEGNSAGANLAIAGLIGARDAGLPLPAGVIVSWPQIDLTESGDTFRTIRGADAMTGGSTAACNALYAAGEDLSRPEMSPLFSDFTKGFPPTLIISGTRDVMLSNAVRLHRALRRAGVAADLNVWEAAPHGGFGGGTPEDFERYGQIRQFLRNRWPPR